jgi:hypothetical protein
VLLELHQGNYFDRNTIIDFNKRYFVCQSQQNRYINRSLSELQICNPVHYGRFDFVSKSGRISYGY